LFDNGWSRTRTRNFANSKRLRDFLRADSPGVDSPGVDSPGVDSPCVDSPGVDSPGVDSPGVDSPGVDSPCHHEKMQWIRGSLALEISYSFTSLR
jgi:hypothetical protein